MITTILAITLGGKTVGILSILGALFTFLVIKSGWKKIQRVIKEAKEAVTKLKEAYEFIELASSDGITNEEKRVAEKKIKAAMKEVEEFLNASMTLWAAIRNQDWKFKKIEKAKELADEIKTK